MTSTTTVELGVSAENFGATYQGIPLQELGEDSDLFIAYGHIETEPMLAAVSDYLDECGVEPAAGKPLSVKHVHATLNHDEAFADDDGWFYTWANITDETPGAFPATVAQF